MTKTATYFGSCCQYNQLGTNIPGPNEVSGASIIFKVTTFDPVLALIWATASGWVRPRRFLPLIDRSTSPFCKRRNQYIYKLYPDDKRRVLRNTCIACLRYGLKCYGQTYRWMEWWMDIQWRNDLYMASACVVNIVVEKLFMDVSTVTQSKFQLVIVLWKCTCLIFIAVSDLTKTENVWNSEHQWVTADYNWLYSTVVGHPLWMWQVIGSIPSHVIPKT